MDDKSLRRETRHDLSQETILCGNGAPFKVPPIVTGVSDTEYLHCLRVCSSSEEADEFSGNVGKDV